MLLRGLACVGYFSPGQCCTALDKVVALTTQHSWTAHHVCTCISPVMRELSGAGTLQQLYRRAMQMEVDFFSAQPGISSAPSVGMLVVDFDDTCTVTDTTSQIFNTAIAATVETASGTAAPKRPRMHSAQHALGSRSIIQNAVLAAYMHFKPVCLSCCKF